MSCSPASSSATSPVASVTKTLTNAQVLALPTTAVQILAAPGASNIVVPLHATLRLAWTADYTGIDAASTIFLESGVGIATARIDNVVANSVNGLLAGGGPDGTVAWLPAIAFVPASATNVVLSSWSSNYDSDVANKAISIAATNAANYTGGHAANTLTVTLLYYIVTF